LVQAGTLNVNDPLVVNGEIYGKVRAMKNYKGENLTTAIPSTPAQIIGFKVAPEVGDVLDVGKAGSAEKIDVRQKKGLQTGAEKQTIVVREEGATDEETKHTLNLLIKADVLGSLEAIIGSMEKLKHEEVGVKIVGKGLGNITEDDVHKAEAGQAIVVGFNVNANGIAEQLMQEKNIQFKRYDIIYDLINWVKDDLEKLLAVEKIITEIGRVKVLAIFRTDKGAMTIGGRVEDGKVLVNSLARIKRGGLAIGLGKITQCQVGQAVMKEVIQGTECGMRFEGKEKIEEGDVLEIYKEESKTRKLVLN
jgi:translation initiation factor IF-2